MFGRRKATPPPEAEAVSAPHRLAPRSPSEALKPSAAPQAPPRIRRSRGGLVGALSGLLTFGVVIALAVAGGATIIDRQAHGTGSLPADKAIVIPRGTGTAEIASILRREGVIEHPLLFEAYAFLKRRQTDKPLRSGEYVFKANTSIDDAIDTLIEGKAVQHAISLPEGLTSEQIVQRIRDNPILSGEIADVPREGSLLPDTYLFDRGMTRQQIINLMQAKQRDLLNQIWSRRAPDLPLRSPPELVTLASIVEKETGKADERPRVAGVFVNRLQKRMRLQSDPTIVYGLVGGKGTLGRGILRTEIEQRTAYNTYVIDGLPPGPIANPGKAAMEAVANPMKTKDLYFVADGTGGHSFAETLDQHQRNVARWRQIERGQAAGAPAGTAAGTAGPVDRVEPPEPAAPSQATAFTDPAAPATGAVTPGAPRRGVDASEGTPRDPLLNRSFDLTTPKTVPNLSGSQAAPAAGARPPAQREAQPRPAPRTPPRREQQRPAETR